ncbi:hypothetical protein DLAC_05280 [Tieghemostelium lacteum]|uniref:BTB domain-containing protein n=1 Tax=Tieghemostelium lacteum TaxID=361077 RepID=A0A151ZJ09_TIELA|nr:hypothetical protein DLAC_05280 [Tieghemostelium lacteum]|eukprot:KYQ93879.1 hypothetical protein DLAC_05280 [Tieghemostelium lacteum]
MTTNLSKNNDRKDHRIILNVGGKRFETYSSTLEMSAFPNSLLSTMFSERNRELIRPDDRGEFFFDRSPKLFEYILNAYRTGEIDVPSHIPWKMFKKELDYFQLPTPPKNNYKLGDRLMNISIEKAREQTSEVLSGIKLYIYDQLTKAADAGKSSEIIQFKSGSVENEEFYSFVSNLRNRELLLLDLVNENLDVHFTEEFGRYYHSYLFQITFYTKFTSFEMSPTDQVLNELRHRVNQLSTFLYKETLKKK